MFRSLRFASSLWKIQGGDDKIYNVINGQNSNVENIMMYYPSSDVTFIAVWEKTYKITFKTEEGYIGEIGKTEFTSLVKKGEKLSYSNIPIAKSDDHIFVGWKKTEETPVIYSTDELYSITPTEDMVFVAQWIECYVVKYHTDEGNLKYRHADYNDLEKDYSVKIKKGTELNCDIIAERDGYIFTGWKIDGEATTYNNDPDSDNYISNYTPTGNVTFIAQWAEGYNVTYYSEQGYVGNPSDEDKAFSEPIEKGKNIYSVPSTDRPGYECIGWKVSGNESLILVYDKSSDNYIYNYKPEGNTCLIAVWKKTEDKEDKKQDEDKKVEVTDKPAENKTQDKTPQAEAPKGGNDEQKGVPVGEVAVDKDIKYIVESEDSVIYEKNDSDKAEVNIPDVVKLNGKEYKVTEISEKAFANNKKLKKITFGSNIEAVGKNAFAGCVNLTNVNVKGNNLKEIKEGAFKGCKKLKQLTLSKNIDTIGNNAFYGDTILKTIVIKSKNVKKIGKNAFKNINKKSTIYVPKKLSNKQFNKYKKMLKKAGLPSTVKIKKK